MDILPDEMLLCIFKYIGVPDLLQCRLVSKRFLAICNSVQIEEVIISHRIADKKNYWFGTNQQFNYRDGVQAGWRLCRNFPIYRKLFELDNSLKRFCYEGGCVTDYELMNLSGFKSLVELRLGLLPRPFPKSDIHLDLPNLKILEIGEDFSLVSEIYLTAPKLEMLNCELFQSIHLAEPDSVRHLEMLKYTESAGQLINVQYLKVDWQQIRHENIISIFPKLRNLNLAWNNSEVDFDASMIDLRLLVAQKPFYMKIYFASVELDDVAKIDKLFPGTILAFQISNYNSICGNISFNGALDYNHLLQLFNGHLPNDFFKKYFDCRALQVADEVCQDHFVWFLKNFRYLNRLELTNIRLDQSFYDRLPELDQLTELVVKNSPIRSHGFLLKMAVFETFITDEDCASLLDVSSEMCSRLKFFTQCSFRVKEEIIDISKVEHCEAFYFIRLTFDTTDNTRKLLYSSSALDIDEIIPLINNYKESLNKID